MTENKWRRRDFLCLSGRTAGVVALTQLDQQFARAHIKAAADVASSTFSGSFNGSYTDDRAGRVSFPMGGIGAGMICLDGTGSLSHVSLCNRPDVFNQPRIFAAISIRGTQPVARVLEGPVPAHKIFGLPGSGDGDVGSTYGLPRFQRAVFDAHFPFGRVSLTDAAVPLDVELTGWSPFEPGDADNSSLPVAALEYNFTNRGSEPIDAVFSLNAANFLITDGCPNAVRPIDRGFVLWNGPATGEPWKEVAFCATARAADVRVNYCWFRGQWWDALTLAWKDVERGACFDSPPVTEASPGASLFVPLRLEPGRSDRVIVQLAWYSGTTSFRYGQDPPNVTEGRTETYRPWYAGHFGGIEEVSHYWAKSFEKLRSKTLRFSNCLYDTTFPPEVIEAVTANLAILKSPTVLRQVDGKLWGWEGCHDADGSCPGSCTHVWNYAQAMPHLFPELERSLRETEFGPSQDDQGRQNYRSAMPIRPGVSTETDAADGQLGGVIKVHREWRISGDDAWLRALWPKVKRSLEYCIKTWDPNHVGLLEEPHHNTYDIEFWGPEPMCTGLYLGALQAAIQMSRTVGDNPFLYEELVAKGTARMESELFNGEYFHQRLRHERLRDHIPKTNKDGTPLSQEARALFEQEGPKYQYGDGCLSDGMLGVWLATQCGISHPLSRAKAARHMRSVHAYNFRSDLSRVANTQRPSYATGKESGLLLCTWPRGGKPSLPIVFSDETWTGIEYQVASHLIHLGMIEEGLEIVRACRNRYDGRVRNPFDEYECGHWYARAMSSYALLEALSGARYDAVDKTLYLKPVIEGDFRSFLSSSTGYGTVGVKNGRPFLEVISGRIPYRKIEYIPAGSRSTA
jgi:uncharacterized protein (DUF608 family)